MIKLILIFLKFVAILIIVRIGLNHYNPANNMLDQHIFVYLFIYVPAAIGLESLSSIAADAILRKVND